MKRLLGMYLAVLSVFVAAPVFAANQDNAKPAAKAEAVPKERKVVTHGSGTVEGEKNPYQASGGELQLFQQEQYCTGSVLLISS